MSDRAAAIGLGGSMRRAPVRGSDPDSRGGRAYLRALARLGGTPRDADGGRTDGDRGPSPR